MILLNGPILASFLVVGVSREELKQLPGLFADRWRRYLAYEGFPSSVIETLMAECSEFTYAKASDKSVLGSMNDIVFHYKWWLMERGASSDDAIHEMNRIPMGALKYNYPIEALKSRVNELSSRAR